MTIAEWLERRDPVPPAQLATQLRLALGTSLLASAAEAPDRLMKAAEALLERSLSGGLTDRASAVDLLTVDALVTYAFEASTGQPYSLRERARSAMRRIAALGGTAP